ncbi:MAG: hypothetical protein RR555_11020 [Bacteroidales bacterium]
MNNITLVPDSIQGSNTVASDLTAADRFRKMYPLSLRIDIENERDLFKLTLLAEMFGIPKYLLPDDLGEFEFRDILRRIKQICSLSGTVPSIRLIAQALNVENVEVFTNTFLLRYDNQADYRGYFHYDMGAEYKGFSVSVEITGIPEDSRANWENTFRGLFNIFQPISIYLQEVRFYSPPKLDTFPVKLPFKLS